MTTKTLALAPGINKFAIDGVQQFGSVEPMEFTSSGWPKNTVTELGEIYIEFDVKTKKCKLIIFSEKRSLDDVEC